jgi:DNA-binding protein HU-beta
VVDFEPDRQLSRIRLSDKTSRLRPRHVAPERGQAYEPDTRKDVKGVIESLAEIGYKELKRAGGFFVPGFAKFVVIKKPATKARKGINPFTKEPTIFKAKPARKIIKARPVKAAKDAIA